MDITSRLTSPSTMVTTNSQLRLDGPSTMGNCQVSWPVNNGYIPLNHVHYRHPHTHYPPQHPRFCPPAHCTHAQHDLFKNQQGHMTVLNQTRNSMPTRSIHD